MKSYLTNVKKWRKEESKLTSKLKSLRVLNNINQDRMAELLGIGKTTYVFKENGKKEFKLSEVKKIKEIFNLSSSEVEQIFFD